MERRKLYFIIIVGIIIGIVLSGITASAIADFKIDSKNVYYNDNSNLLADNVQDAIDGTCTKFESKVDNFLDKIYPIGSIYISATLSTVDQVKGALGGTWEAYGKGQTLVGIDTSQTEFNTIGKTGGAKSVSYTPSGTIGSTGLTISQIPSHTHTTPQTNTTTMSLKAQATGSEHSHTFGARNDGFGSAGIVNGVIMTQAFYDKTGFMGGAHTHTVTGSVTIPAMITNSISTASSGAAGKGTTSDGHTHSFTGIAASISTLQPYVTVYMYKRTA